MQTRNPGRASWIVPFAAALFLAPAVAAQMPDSEIVAPGGIAIGMTPEAAGVALLAAGWEQKSKCEFHLGPAGARGSPRVNLFTVDHGVLCKEGQPVRHIQYKYMSAGVVDGAAAVEKLTADVGGPAACHREVTDRRAQCAWNTPARFPLVKLFDLDVSGQFLTMHTVSVPDLDRPHTPPEPFDPAFDPMTPVTEVDPLAPGGVKVGMPLDEAEEALSAAGFTKSRSSITCVWSLERKYEMATQIQLQTISEKNRIGCAEGEPIHRITFRKIDYRPDLFDQAPAPEAMTAAWTKQVKAQENEGACTQKTGTAEATCLWGPEKGKNASSYSGAQPPAGVPGLEQVKLTYTINPREHATTVQVEMSGPNPNSKLTSPDDPLERWRKIQEERQQ